MIKIWCKTYKNFKIVKNISFVKDEEFKLENLYYYLVDICYALEIPTPIVMRTHLKNYYLFNHAKFIKSDFVEKVNFDYLLIENSIF